MNKKRGVLLVVLCHFLIFTSCKSMAPFAINRVSPVIPEMLDSVMSLENLRICKEGMPGLIVLISALAEYSPNLDILSTCAMAYTAMGLIVEDEDIEYAKQLYWMGKSYGLRALKTNDDFREDVEENGVRIKDAVLELDEDYVPAMFWTAMSWGQWAFLKLGEDVTAALCLPAVMTMMKRLEELDDTYFFGGVYLYKMALNAMMPEFAGGGEAKVDKNYKIVMDMSNGQFMLPMVFYAKFFCKPYGRRDAFHESLTKVMNFKTTERQYTLANEIAKEKAKILLAREEDYFQYDKY